MTIYIDTKLDWKLENNMLGNIPKELFFEIERRFAALNEEAVRLNIDKDDLMHHFYWKIIDYTESAIPRREHIYKDIVKAIYEAIEGNWQIIKDPVPDLVIVEYGRYETNRALEVQKAAESLVEFSYLSGEELGEKETIMGQIHRALDEMGNPTLMKGVMTKHHDIETVRQWIDYLAMKFPALAPDNYMPIAQMNNPNFRIATLIESFFPDIAKEHIAYVEAKLGKQINSISRFTTGKGALAAYVTYAEDGSPMVLKFSHNPSAKLEFRTLELVQELPFINLSFPKPKEDSYMDLGDYGFFFMEDITRKITVALANDPIENMVRLIANLHHYQKEKIWEQELRSLGLKDHTYADVSFLKKTIPLLETINKISNRPISDITTLIDYLIVHAGDYENALDAMAQSKALEMGVRHADTKWENIYESRILFDFGNVAYGALIKDLSMLLGDKKAAVMMKALGRDVSSYLKSYIDERKKLDSKYNCELKNLIELYNASVIVDQYSFALSYTRGDQLHADAISELYTRVDNIMRTIEYKTLMEQTTEFIKIMISKN